MKRILIVSPYEEIPIKKTCLERSGRISNIFLERGYEVVWFSSSFDHQIKKRKVWNQKDSSNIKVEIIKTIPYFKNISLLRIISNFILGINLFIRLRKYKNSDYIYSTVPILETSYFAAIFASKNNIPLIIDYRDLWPEIFTNYIKAPNWVKNIILSPFYSMKKYILKKAKYLTSISEKMLELIREKNINAEDFVLYHHFDGPAKEDSLNLTTKFKSLNLDNELKTRIIFAGSFSNRHDFQTIINVIEKFQNIDLIIAGDGEQDLSKFSKLNNVKLVGQLNKEELHFLYSKCNFSFLPYPNDLDLNRSIPRKFSEYMYFGLPVISTNLKFLSKIIHQRNIGFTYEHKNKKELERIFTKITMIKKHDQDMSNLIRNCKKTYNQLFSLKVFKEKIAKHIP